MWSSTKYPVVEKINMIYQTIAPDPRRQNQTTLSATNPRTFIMGLGLNKAFVSELYAIPCVKKWPVLMFCILFLLSS